MSPISEGCEVVCACPIGIAQSYATSLRIATGTNEARRTLRSASSTRGSMTPWARAARTSDSPFARSTHVSSPARLAERSPLTSTSSLEQEGGTACGRRGRRQGRPVAVGCREHGAGERCGLLMPVRATTGAPRTPWVRASAMSQGAGGPTLLGLGGAMTAVEVREFSGRWVAPVQAYGQRALTAATTFVSESLASPNNSVVFGSKSSSLLMPAKPGRIERFMNTMLRASSTARMGIP